LSPLRCSNCTKQIGLARRSPRRQANFAPNERWLGTGFAWQASIERPPSRAQNQLYPQCSAARRRELIEL
jgi:hypothetical protein